MKRHFNWTYGSRTMSLREWADDIGMGYKVLQRKIRNLRRKGCTPDGALAWVLEEQR